MFQTTALVALSLTPLVQSDGAPDEPERGLHSRAEAAFDGYTLLAPLRSTTTYLVDMDGEVVHTWESDLPPGNHAYLLDDGTLLRGSRIPTSPTFHAGGQGGRLRQLSWTGEVLWEHTLSDEKHLHHHDVEMLPNGNLLVIAYEAKTREEAIAMGRDPDATAAAGLWPDMILEITPTPPRGARTVWEWHAWDHLIQDRDPEKPNFGAVGDHPERIDINADHRDDEPLTEEEIRAEHELAAQMAALGYIDSSAAAPTGDDGADSGPFSRADWLHTNSVSYHPEYDLIVTSSPRFDEIWVIDHSTTTEEAAGSKGGRWGHGGDLLYRYGNPARYGLGGADQQRLFAQHDATWVAGNDDLRIQILNNGQQRPELEYSSVDEIVLPFHPKSGFFRADGQAFEPFEPEWSYVAPEPADFYAAFISGAQRLPNGNTLICSGPDGRVFEVTRGGEVVWDFWSPFTGDAELLATPPPHLRPSAPPSDDTSDADAEDAPAHQGPMVPHGLFRATRIPPDHPGLAGKL